MNPVAESAAYDGAKPKFGWLASWLRRLFYPCQPAIEERAARQRAVACPNLQVNLSGTSLGFTKPTSRLKAAAGVAGPQIKIERLAIIGQPIRVQQASFELDFLAKNLRFAKAAQDDSRPNSLIDLDHGQITVLITPEDFQRLLTTVADEFLREYHVTISEAAVRFETPSRRQLLTDLQVTAKRGWLRARVQVTGGLAIDEDLQARVCDLQLRGRGILGRLIAAMATRRLRSLQEKQFSLRSPSLLGVRPRNIEFTAMDILRIRIELAGSSTHQPTIEEQASLPVNVDNLIAPPAPKSVTPRKSGRLDIYVIDTGRNEFARRELESHLQRFEGFLREHMVYVLSQEQSQGILDKTRVLIGQDPILVMVDSDARIESARHGYGIRLCLGGMRRDRLSDNLTMVLQIASERDRTTGQILRRLRKECHKQGLPWSVMSK